MAQSKWTWGLSDYIFVARYSLNSFFILRSVNIHCSQCGGLHWAELFQLSKHEIKMGPQHHQLLSNTTGFFKANKHSVCSSGTSQTLNNPWTLRDYPGPERAREAEMLSEWMFHGSYLSAHSSYLSFIHAGFCDDVSQRTSSQILHHHPQLIAHQVTMETRHQHMQVFMLMRGLVFKIILSEVRREKMFENQRGLSTFNLNTILYIYIYNINI